MSSINSTVPQCSDIKFDTTKLFVKDQVSLSTQLENLGFSTINGSISSSSILLPVEDSEVLLKKTIIEFQSTFLYAIRQVLKHYYIDLKNVLESSCSSSSASKTISAKSVARTLLTYNSLYTISCSSGATANQSTAL